LLTVTLTLVVRCQQMSEITLNTVSASVLTVIADSDIDIGG